MQVYSLCSAVLMSHRRRVECEDYKRGGDIELALLAVESCHYWQRIQIDRLGVLQTVYRGI